MIRGVVAAAVFAFWAGAVGAVAAVPQAVSFTADRWVVEVSVSYISKAAKSVSGVPVIQLEVPVGECATAETRLVALPSRSERVSQRICVSRNGDKTIIHGWVFAGARLADQAIRSDYSLLQYGQPLHIETDGQFIRTVAGPYAIVANRRAAWPVVPPVGGQ